MLHISKTKVREGEILFKMVKRITKIGEYYQNLRCKGYSQAKAMERVIMFTKKTPSVREKVIRNMLITEKKLKCRKR